MGTIMKVMVVLLVLFNFYFPATSAPLANNLNSGNPSEKMKEKQKDESNDSITGGKVGPVNQTKFAHAGARGGGGGHSAGGGGNGGGGQSAGGGGQSTSSSRGGGAAVIPVFAAGAAGAAGQRNNHRSAAGICSRCRKDMILIDVATTFALVLLWISA